jgi:hypothetical protein
MRHPSRGPLPPRCLRNPQKPPMSDSHSPACPSVKDRFTWYEKLIARAGIGGAVLAATIAIYRDSKPVALAYIALVAVGGVLVVYDFLCVYCPYPFRYSDCLFYPHQLVSAIARLRGGRIHWLRKAGAAAVFGAIFAVPQPWLWDHGSLLAAFWALTLPLAVLFPLHLCRRCRHEQCPMNRASSQ